MTESERNDIRIYGSAVKQTIPDGTVKRIDPTTIRIISMSQESEQATELWRKYYFEYFGTPPDEDDYEYEADEYGRDLAACHGILDYKAALKAEIEKMLIKMPYNAAHSRLCDVLSLLDTVKPL